MQFEWHFALARMYYTQVIPKRVKNKVNYFQNLDKDDYQGRLDLENSEQGLKRYTNSIVQQLLNQYPRGIQKDVIIDFGAGTGHMANLVKDQTGTAPICIEIDPRLSERISDRYLQTFESLTDTRIPKANLIYSSNVLEHIEDDSEALSQIYNQLLPGGHVALFVPAFPFLYSRFDFQVGHFRRYTRGELHKKLRLAGFQDISIRYFDSLGILTWLVMKIIGIRPSTRKGESSLMVFYDNVVFPVARILDVAGMSRVAGKNLVVLAKKVEASV